MKTLLVDVVPVVNPLLDPSPVAPPGVEELVNTLLSWLMWGGLIAAVVGFIGAGIALMIANRRGEGQEHVKSLGYVCLGGILVMSASGLAQALIH